MSEHAFVKSEAKAINDRRKYCPGCKKNRSAFQYNKPSDTVCKTCVLRKVSP